MVADGAAGVCIANDDAMALRRSSPGVYPTFTTELPPPAPPCGIRGRWHCPPARSATLPIHQADFVLSGSQE